MMTNHIGGVSTNPIESEFRDLPRFESTLLYAVQDFDPAGNVLHFEAGRTILFWTILHSVLEDRRRRVGGAEGRNPNAVRFEVKPQTFRVTHQRVLGRDINRRPRPGLQAVHGGGGAGL